MTAHTDLTVANHATGNPWDHNDPANEQPQPEDREERPEARRVGSFRVTANPLRGYLEAIGVELLIAKGAVREAWKQALALALEHSYGVTAEEAMAKVESAVASADRHTAEDAAEGLEWDAVKYDRARDLITWAVLR